MSLGFARCTLIFSDAPLQQLLTLLQPLVLLYQWTKESASFIVRVDILRACGRTSAAATTVHFAVSPEVPIPPRRVWRNTCPGRA
jgi:hypothetical protein